MLWSEQNDAMKKTLARMVATNLQDRGCGTTLKEVFRELEKPAEKRNLVGQLAAATLAQNGFDDMGEDET